MIQINGQRTAGRIKEIRKSPAQSIAVTAVLVPSAIKNELSRIFLEDLYDGSRRTGFFAKKADVTEFLNSWLDKYKSQEELQELLKRIL